jgi:hypothetical protein
MNKIEELESLCTDLWYRLIDSKEEDKQPSCKKECRCSCEYDAWNYENEKCIYYKRMKKLGLLKDVKKTFEDYAKNLYD